jgi:uncharacterized protein HemX
MIRLYLLLFIIGTFSAAGYSGYKYVINLQNQVLTLRENNVKLELVAETQRKTLAQQEANATRQAELNKELNTALVQAESGLDALRKRFTQIDINKEAIEDPEGLEVRVNNAVQKLISKIQSDTSPAVPAE